MRSLWCSSWLRLSDAKRWLLVVSHPDSVMARVVAMGSTQPEGDSTMPKVLDNPGTAGSGKHPTNGTNPVNGKGPGTGSKKG